MKSIFTTLLLVLLSVTSLWAQSGVSQSLPKALFPHAQHKTIAGKDTVIESDTTKENKEPQYFYVFGLADIFANTHGGLANGQSGFIGPVCRRFAA